MREGEQHHNRDALTAAFQASHPLVTLIESRVTQVVSEAQALLDVIDCAPENARDVQFVAAEPLQVVRYAVSQGAWLSCSSLGTCALVWLTWESGYVQHFDNRSGSQARKGALHSARRCQLVETEWQHQSPSWCT